MVGLRGPPEVPLPAPTHPVVLVTATGLVIRFNSPCPFPEVGDGIVSTDGLNADAVTMVLLRGKQSSIVVGTTIDSLICYMILVSESMLTKLVLMNGYDYSSADIV